MISTVSRTILVCLISALPFSGQADNGLFATFMAYERAIAACSGVPCYRAVLETYGSRATRHRAAQFTEQQMRQPFRIANGIAVDRVEKAELYVVDTLVEHESATLTLASKTYPGLTETVYFVKESGARH